MKKSQLPHSPKVYAILACLWAFLVLAMPKSGKFNYDYKKGSPWTYETLVAQFDFPLLKSSDQLQEEKEKAGSSVIPYYKFSSEISHSVIRSVESLDAGQSANLIPELVGSLNTLYSKGVISEDSADLTHGSIIFVQKDKRAAKVPYPELYNLKSARLKLLSDLESVHPELNVDSLFENMGIYSLIEPNLVYDKETTELVHAENADYISPTVGFVSAGQLIVSKGELVTAEIQQMIDSYKAEYEDSIGYSGSRLLLWFGNIFLALVIVLIFFLSVFYTNPKIFDSLNQFFYLVVVMAISASMAFVLEKVNPDLLYLAPFTLIALFMLAFFQKRVVLPVYIISLIPLLVFSHNGIELFVMYLSAGVVTMYLYRFLGKGWKQFVMSMISFVAVSLAFLGFRFTDDTGLNADMDKLLYLFLGSVFPVAGYPLIFLFEKLFMLVSNNRLLELCDTNNNKLINQLAQKAPGTFQHSLQVMNMADYVSSAIEANALLARAGALYHDIGKLSNPQCFVENATPGNNYHSGLSPQESAREIIKHVTDGLAIADKYAVPQVIKDFIITHHGTSKTGYFYTQFVNAGGDPQKVEDFTYHGRKPWTTEQSIVMLCDTLEAASRTLKDYKKESIAKLVEDIVASKMAEGQLSDADVTLRELGQIKALLRDYLAGMYHDRIAYPKRTR